MQSYYKCVYVAYRVVPETYASGTDTDSVLAFREIGPTCVFGQSADGGKVATTRRFAGNGNNSPKRFIRGGGPCPTRQQLPGNFAYFTDDISVYIYMFAFAYRGGYSPTVVVSAPGARLPFIAIPINGYFSGTPHLTIRTSELDLVENFEKKYRHNRG